MRANPDLGPPRRPSDQVPVRVDLDLEPGLPHPRCGQDVSLVLARAPGRPVGAGSASDRVELVETIEDALHRATLTGTAMSDVRPGHRKGRSVVRERGDRVLGDGV